MGRSLTPFNQAMKSVLKEIANAAIVVMGSVWISGCGKPVSPTEHAVSFWADPKNGEDTDPCVHATARAIVSSGLPYPNILNVDAAASTTPGTQPASTVDVWIGSTRFVLPEQVVVSNGMYGANHPMRFWKLQGNLPNFYPPGSPGPVIDGMGPMVEVGLQCWIGREPVLASVRGYKSNQEGIQAAKERYEKDLDQRGRDKWPAASVTVNARPDIGMTEVLYARGGQYNDGQPMWEASYWPMTTELRGPLGEVNAIECATRHDPEGRYGKTGWRCRLTSKLTPVATATIEIYVAHIKQFPAIFQQVMTLLLNGRAPEPAAPLMK